MKKTLLIPILLCVFVVNTLAKTTYIPTYFSQIEISEKGIVDCDSSILREFSMNAKDNRYTITVLHDSVTAERVKAIKQMKAASGWAMAASIMGGVSAGLNPLRNGRDAVSYMNSMHTIAAGSMLNIAAKEGANNLQHVPISIVITNNSDREMTVSDMNRGLVWYIPAHEYLKLDVGNPEINRLRIAYNDDCKDQQINYVTIQTANVLTKQEITYEDETQWIFPEYNDAYFISGYTIVNKVTFEISKMTPQEYKLFLKEQKDLKKQSLQKK